MMSTGRFAVWLIVALHGLSIVVMMLCRITGTTFPPTDESLSIGLSGWVIYCGGLLTTAFAVHHLWTLPPEPPT